VGYARSYSGQAPELAEVAALPGAAVLEFGTGWCGYCQAAQPAIEAAFASHPQVRHLKVEDGRRRPLGRAFRVKLWPTLVFLRDGRELARVVRPREAREVAEGLARIDPGARMPSERTHGDDMPNKGTPNKGMPAEGMP